MVTQEFHRPSTNRNKDPSAKDSEFESTEEWLKKFFLSWYSLCSIKFASDSASASHDEEAIFPKQINGSQLEISSAN